MSPFEALYGLKPPSLVVYSSGSSKFDSLDYAFSTRQTILQLLKGNLSASPAAMAQQFNSKRLDREFNEGDWVFLKLQPYRQILVQCRSLQKLAPHYFGPFRIIRRIGAIAYELELPKAAVFTRFFISPCSSLAMGHLVIKFVRFPPSLGS
ncbi:UNVERIFIED_CONTAM: hypothetical protein Sradi_7092700 [Sesamum radiatum]|uniref:Tf2-1-like SH3-like domain-containing protein n=1 Tax=Sesamum radiatum TaxID=300843 RepID=A0AAW2J2L7_SESRA